MGFYKEVKATKSNFFEAPTKKKKKKKKIVSWLWACKQAIKSITLKTSVTNCTVIPEPIYRIVSNKRSPSNKRPPNLFSNKTR